MKIIIKESQLALLLEADKRETIKKLFGFNDDWVNEFHQLSDKYSVWIADNLIKEVSSSVGRYINNIVETFNRLHPDDSAVWRRERQKFISIIDWKRGDVNAQRINLNDISFREAYRLSQEWHKSLNSKIQNNYEEKNEIFIDYRDDRGVGYYWANLKKRSCPDEKERMGHCASGAGVLFSLRSIDSEGNGHSHLTCDYDDGRIRQLKGRYNSKPTQKYHPYIVDLLINEKYPVNSLTHTDYGASRDFHLSDLSSADLKRVYDNNYNLKYSTLNKFNIDDFIDNVGLDGFKTLSLDKKFKVLRLTKTVKNKFYPELLEAMRDEPEKNEVLRYLSFFRKLTRKELSVFFEDTESIMSIFINIHEYIKTSADLFLNKFDVQILQELEAHPEKYNIGFVITSLSYFSDCSFFCEYIEKRISQSSNNTVISLLRDRNISREVKKCFGISELYSVFDDFSLPTSQGYFSYRIGKLWGVAKIVNLKPELLTKPKYTRIGQSENGIICRTEDNKFEEFKF